MATSITNSSSSALYGQLQQAQRNVDQAVQRARSLQAEAQQAQAEANRAQSNAQAIQSDSRQASSDADQARRGLTALQVSRAPQTQLTSPPPKVGNSPAAPPETTDLPLKPAPVVNAFGQQTGTLISVTA